MEYDQDSKPKTPAEPLEPAERATSNENFSAARWDRICGIGRKGDLEQFEPSWIPRMCSSTYANYDPGLTELGVHLVSKFGEGANGAVFAAWDDGVGAFIALKGIPECAFPHEHDRYFTALLREAEVTTGIMHPHILSVRDLIKGERGPYLVMAPEAHLDFTPTGLRIVGNGDFESAAHALHRAGPVDAQNLIPILEQFIKVTGAVVHLHDRGILHGDLKPKNILLDYSGEPLLADFGLSRFILPGDSTSFGRDDLLAGSAGYTAPEIVAKNSTAVMDRRSEVYALGAILYTALSGTAPFAEVHGLHAKFFAAAYREPVGIKELNPLVPEELAAICNRAMSRNPEERFQTADELLEAIDLSDALRHQKLAG